QDEESQMLEGDERHQEVAEEGHGGMLVPPWRTRPGKPAPAAAGSGRTPSLPAAAPLLDPLPGGNLRPAPPSGSEKGLLSVSSTPSARAALVAGLTADATPGESLAPWTSLRVGGPAELLVRPRAPDALVAVLARARAEGIPVHVLGGGANTLVGDLGIPGITLKLPADLFAEEVHPLAPGGGGVTLGAGAAIVRLPNVMRARGWVGAEFLAGIPGTIGGAVAMNAGTKNGECERVLEAVELATPDGIGWVPRSALTLRYRFTELP